MSICLVILILNFIYIACLPTTQTGIVVISGVSTCGQGRGYCLRGNDCSINEDLEPDQEGHCDGLHASYVPKMYFSCCRYVSKNSSGIMNYVPTAILNNSESDILDAIDMLRMAEDVKQPTYFTKNSPHEIKEVPTAVLDDTGAEISDSIDILHRANDFADINNRPANSDHTENEASNGINVDEQVVSTSDINYVCCSPETTTTNDSLNEVTPATLDTISSRSVDLDGADESSDEFFQIRRALFGDYTKNERNCTTHDFASLLPLSTNVLQEQRGAAIKEKFDKNKCLNLTSQFESNQNDEGCINIWKFVSQNDLLCFGTLISSVWLLTSAACITRMFQDGIDTIIVTDIEEKSGYYGISNVIVHENYMTDGLRDMHDVGLVSLNQIVNASCFGCLPTEEKKYADKSCVTYTNDRYRRGSLGKCQDRLKILNMNSKMYLSLPCVSDDEQPLTPENYAANALWCENKLVGIETSYDQGLFVFTPINEYVDWISQNVQLYL